MPVPAPASLAGGPRLGSFCFLLALPCLRSPPAFVFWFLPSGVFGLSVSFHSAKKLAFLVTDPTGQAAQGARLVPGRFDCLPLVFDSCGRLDTPTDQSAAIAAR